MIIVTLGNQEPLFCYSVDEAIKLAKGYLAYKEVKTLCIDRRELLKSAVA